MCNNILSNNFVSFFCVIISCIPFFLSPSSPFYSHSISLSFPPLTAYLWAFSSLFIDNPFRFYFRSNILKTFVIPVRLRVTLLDQQIERYFVHHNECLSNPLLFYENQIIYFFLNSKFSQSQ